MGFERAGFSHIDPGLPSLSTTHDFGHEEIEVEAYVQDSHSVLLKCGRYDNFVRVRDADAAVGVLRYLGQKIRAPQANFVRFRILSGTRKRHELRLEEIANKIELLTPFGEVVRAYE